MLPRRDRSITAASSTTISTSCANSSLALRVRLSCFRHHDVHDESSVWHRIEFDVHSPPQRRPFPWRTSETDGCGTYGLGSTSVRNHWGQGMTKHVGPRTEHKNQERPPWHGELWNGFRSAQVGGGAGGHGVFCRLTPRGSPRIPVLNNSLCPWVPLCIVMARFSIARAHTGRPRRTTPRLAVAAY